MHDNCTITGKRKAKTMILQGRRWVKMYNAPLMMVEKNKSFLLVFRVVLHGGG